MAHTTIHSSNVNCLAFSLRIYNTRQAQTITNRKILNRLRIQIQTEKQILNMIKFPIVLTFFCFSFILSTDDVFAPYLLYILLYLFVYVLCTI